MKAQVREQFPRIYTALTAILTGDALTETKAPVATR